MTVNYLSSLVQIVSRELSLFCFLLILMYINFTHPSITGHHSELREDLLEHDEALMPLWRDFSTSISNFTGSSSQVFLVIIQDVQLSRSVLDLLAPALNGHNHLGGLLLRNNRLPRHGVQFVSTFIEMNKSIKHPTHLQFVFAREFTKRLLLYFHA